MMIIKDVVYCREYQNKNGEEKKDYINVGSLFIKDDGGISIALKPWIDLSAFATDGGKVWLRVYDCKEKGKNGVSAATAASAATSAAPAAQAEQAPQAGKRGSLENAPAEVQAVAQAMGGPVDLVPQAGFDDDVPF